MRWLLRRHSEPCRWCDQPEHGWLFFNRVTYLNNCRCLKGYC